MNIKDVEHIEFESDYNYGDGYVLYSFMLEHKELITLNDQKKNCLLVFPLLFEDLRNIKRDFEKEWNDNHLVYTRKEFQTISTLFEEYFNKIQLAKKYHKLMIYFFDCVNYKDKFGVPLRDNHFPDNVLDDTYPTYSMYVFYKGFILLLNMEKDMRYEMEALDFIYLHDFWEPQFEEIIGYMACNMTVEIPDEIARFFTGGHFTVPRKQAEKDILFGFIASFFDFDKEYSECEVDFFLNMMHNDVCLIRRSLIEYKYFDRTNDCRKYWRIN